jgi:enoyl-CoA hydratase/carnithine racemase
VGLVDELADDPEAVAHERLLALAAHPRETYAHTKALLRAGVTSPSAEDERRFRERELPVWTSDSIRERVLAVLKR